jgi:formylglycine-generating enzyme required for sulfatase activity
VKPLVPALALAAACALGVGLAGLALGAPTTAPPAPSASAASAPTSAGAIPAGAPVEPESEDDGSEVEAPPPSPIPVRPPNAHVKVPFEDGMFRLPGGKFTQGSNATGPGPSNERPAHLVTLAPFWIDYTEVTVGAYRACVTAKSCARPARSSAACTYDKNDANLPVSCVHWADADAFCRYAGKRLPSESEWEFSARGTTAVHFPWGGAGGNCSAATTLIHEATGKSCSPEGPKDVGAHPSGASLFGVLDLSGNVEEWTRDWYTPTAAFGSGAAPLSGASHVLRGGGWMSPPSQSRTVSRNWGSTVEAGPNVGFRCAKDAKDGKPR